MRKNEKAINWRIYSKTKRKSTRWTLWDNWMDTGKSATETLVERINTHPKRIFKLVAESF